ncbi:MAG: leucine-rich repeat protein, partial [Eubacterium sp.]|nr:leucine-rich repeat protein [Eubacterium sp.]
SGTSMATPHISACAAMIMVNNPGVTPAQVESMLRGCARDLGATGWDMYYGAGVPDMTKVTTPVVVPTPTPTTTQAPTPKPVVTMTPVVPTPVTTVTPLPTRAPIYTPTPTYNPIPTYNPNPTTSPDPSTGIIHDPSGYYYRVRSDLTAMIVGYDGPGGYITTPTSLGGYPVQYISDGAFRNNTSIRMLTITGTCLISNEAFAGCSNLQSITVTGIVNSVGSRVFGDCTGLSSVTITGMVFNCTNDAFSGCTALRVADVNGIIDNSVKSAILAAPGNPRINMIGLVT